MAFLQSASQTLCLVNVYIWKLLSGSLSPKVILLSDPFCITFTFEYKKLLFTLIQKHGALLNKNSGHKFKEFEYSTTPMNKSCNWFANNCICDHKIKEKANFNFKF